MLLAPVSGTSRRRLHFLRGPQSHKLMGHLRRRGRLPAVISLVRLERSELLDAYCPPPENRPGQ